MGEVIKNPCSHCRGEGRVLEEEMISIKIPVGVAEGQYLNMRGEGNCGPRGGASGDLLVVITEKKDDFYTREGDDLHCDIQVPIHRHVLGGSQRIPTLEGGELSIKISSGTQVGSILRLREQGLYPLNGRGGRGNLFVTIQAYIPKDLSSKEKQLYQEESFIQKMKKMFS
jgi:molecular chaperone DnaJ